MRARAVQIANEYFKEYGKVFEVDDPDSPKDAVYAKVQMVEIDTDNFIWAMCDYAEECVKTAYDNGFNVGFYKFNEKIDARIKELTEEKKTHLHEWLTQKSDMREITNAIVMQINFELKFLNELRQPVVISSFCKKCNSKDTRAIVGDVTWQCKSCGNVFAK